MPKNLPNNYKPFSWFGKNSTYCIALLIGNNLDFENEEHEFKIMKAC